MPGGKVVGIVAIALSLALVALYLPGSPSALLPVEWVIFGIWMIGGAAMYGWARVRYGVHAPDSAAGP